MSRPRRASTEADRAAGASVTPDLAAWVPAHVMAGLTPVEIGALWLLAAAAWDAPEPGRLPWSLSALAVVVRMDPAQARAVMSGLARVGVLVRDGSSVAMPGLVRLAEHRRHVSERAAAAARARWAGQGHGQGQGPAPPERRPRPAPLADQGEAGVREGSPGGGSVSAKGGGELAVADKGDRERAGVGHGAAPGMVIGACPNVRHRGGSGIVPEPGAVGTCAAGSTELTRAGCDRHADAMRMQCGCTAVAVRPVSPAPPSFPNPSSPALRRSSPHADLLSAPAEVMRSVRSAEAPDAGDADAVRERVLAAVAASRRTAEEHERARGVERLLCSRVWEWAAPGQDRVPQRMARDLAWSPHASVERVRYVLDVIDRAAEAWQRGRAGTRRPNPLGILVRGLGASRSRPSKPWHVPEDYARCVGEQAAAADTLRGLRGVVGRRRGPTPRLGSSLTDATAAPSLSRAGADCLVSGFETRATQRNAQRPGAAQLAPGSPGPRVVVGERA